MPRVMLDGFPILRTTVFMLGYALWGIFGVRVRDRVRGCRTIPKIVCGAIFNITLGHPGLVRQTSCLLQFQYRRAWRGLTDLPVMLHYLASPDFRDCMLSSHALFWAKKRKVDLTKMKPDFYVMPYIKWTLIQHSLGIQIILRP